VNALREGKNNKANTALIIAKLNATQHAENLPRALMDFFIRAKIITATHDNAIPRKKLVSTAKYVVIVNLGIRFKILHNADC
jgi:hypothetical protein